jgi:hypothetical protein
VCSEKVSCFFIDSFLLNEIVGGLQYFPLLSLFANVVTGFAATQRHVLRSDNFWSQLFSLYLRRCLSPLNMAMPKLTTTIGTMRIHTGRSSTMPRLVKSEEAAEFDESDMLCVIQPRVVLFVSAN